MNKDEVKNWLKDYPMASNLFCRYPVSAIGTYAEIEKECLTTTQPTLEEITKHYGKDDKGMEEWMNSIIKHLLHISSVTYDFMQLASATDMMLKACKKLKPVEVMIFCSRFNSGKYESFYQKFDIQKLTRSVDAFLKDKQNMLYQIEKDKEEQNRKTMSTDKTESRQIYIRHLLEAIDGREDARQYLRLDGWEAIARCVACCIRFGDLQWSILNKIPTEWHEKIEYLATVQGPIMGVASR